MHRLYWKIFLAFWLSLVFFVTVTLVAASYYLQQTRARAADENPHQRHMTLIREARSIARGEGTDGLERWLAQLDRREVTPYYLLDQQSRDLLGRPLPPDLVFRLGRQRSHLGQMGQMGDMMMRQAMAIPVAGGRSFMLVPDFQGVTMWRVLGRPRVFALPLLVTALLSGLLCYWLARYLLRPVKELREATQAMAAGDFAQRVAPGLGGRRDEIADLAHDFDHMAARIEQLMTSQMQLLGDISHELRSPLARLVVALELAQQKQGGAASAEFERIAIEAERMNDLIGQLLTLSRLESGAGKIAPETVDMSALLERLVENCNFELAADDRRAVIGGAGRARRRPGAAHQRLRKRHSQRGPLHRPRYRGRSRRAHRRRPARSPRARPRPRHHGADARKYFRPLRARRRRARPRQRRLRPRPCDREARDRAARRRDRRRQPPGGRAGDYDQFAVSERGLNLGR